MARGCFHSRQNIRPQNHSKGMALMITTTSITMSTVLLLALGLLADRLRDETGSGVSTLTHDQDR